MNLSYVTSAYGNYLIKINSYSSNNYNITNPNTTATFFVTQRSLTIKANDVSVEYGSALDYSSLNYSLIGDLVNSDTIDVAFTTTYTIGDIVGEQAELEIASVSGDKTINIFDGKV